MSDQDTTKNFIEVMQSFKWPSPPSIFYRLYYNNDGSLAFYSMEDLPGKYIEIDKDTFAARPGNVKVIDGKLHIIQPKTIIQQLIKSTVGTPCHVDDVTVVVEKNQLHTNWSQTSNEIN